MIIVKKIILLCIYWGEPERDPHDAVYGDFVCLSCCLFVRAFTFRIYTCSNSTITHAQNLRAKFFSHVVCTCSYILVRVRVGVRRVRGAWVAFENKNKPVSPPIVVTMCTAMLRLAP